MSLELGRLVQQRRHELGLSRRELAAQSDVSYPYVSQIETGDRDPSLRTMRKLAEILQLPVEEMATLVSTDAWVSETLSAPMLTRTSAISHRDSVDLYRDKVLPSVERRDGVPWGGVTRGSGSSVAVSVTDESGPPRKAL